MGKINETNSKLAQGSEQWFIERNKDTRNRTLCSTSMLEKKSIFFINKEQMYDCKIKLYFVWNII